MKVWKKERADMKIFFQGTMANSREFKEAFGCEVKEPECELW